MGLNCSFA